MEWCSHNRQEDLVCLFQFMPTPYSVKIKRAICRTNVYLCTWCFKPINIDWRPLGYAPNAQTKYCSGSRDDTVVYIWTDLSGRLIVTALVWWESCHHSRHIGLAESWRTFSCDNLYVGVKTPSSHCLLWNRISPLLVFCIHSGEGAEEETRWVLRERFPNAFSRSFWILGHSGHIRLGH